MSDAREDDLSVAAAPWNEGLTEDPDTGWAAPDTDDAEAQARVNSALRRIAALDTTARTVTQVALLEAAKIDAWKTGQMDRIMLERAWWEHGVLSWLRQHHERTGVKTVKLPNGQLTVRPGRSRVHVELDEEGLRLLAKDHPGFVRAKIEPDKVAIGKGVAPAPEPVADHPMASLFSETAIHPAVDENGELLVGVYVLVPTEMTYAAKPAAEQEL